MILCVFLSADGFWFAEHSAAHEKCSSVYSGQVYFDCASPGRCSSRRSGGSSAFPECGGADSQHVCAAAAAAARLCAAALQSAQLSAAAALYGIAGRGSAICSASVSGLRHAAGASAVRPAARL